MDSINLTTLISIAGFIAAILAPILTLQKIQRNIRKDKELEAAKILQEAKEEDALLTAKLEAKIQALDIQIKTLESSIEKDLNHLKESYSSEIKNLGDKIEQLRQQLNDQHAGVLGLLSKLVDKD